MSRRIGVICLALALSVPAYATMMSVAWNVGTQANGDWRLDVQDNAPVKTTAALTQSTMVIPENDSGGYADGQLQGLGQMLNITSDISAKAFSIKIGGLGAGAYTMAIYDVGPSGYFTSITPDPYDVSTRTPEFSASFTTVARSAQVIAFNILEGTVDLYGGERYMFVITETISGALVWMRGNPQGGEMMVTTNGGGGGMNVWRNILQYRPDTTNYRTATLAIYTDIVPEPATMALLGLGGLAILRRKH